MEIGKKYTVNVAYTTPSGRMHIGHGLGHTISDVALRYGSLCKNSETFFGFGMHSTGKDLIKILRKLENEKGLNKTLEVYNISKEKRSQIISLGSLSEKVDVLVQEYRRQYKEIIKNMGLAMDYDSFFSTNQEANQKYTQWTLKKLEEKGVIVETEADRPYCSKCDDIKHIDKDLSEVSAIGKINWNEVMIRDGQIYGGEFECRLHSGEKINVKKRKERAINYADPKMQQKTISLVKNMKVYPKKYKGNIERIVQTRLAKPFERNADENVGAISPFDSTKKVEALSDSNIYMEFYGVSQLINQGRLKVNNLTDKFFDYVYLGRGNLRDVAEESGLEIRQLEEVKSHVESIYPVDVSVVGFEHMEVHLPFSLFTHAAVLPERYFFPEYVITSHITREGEKMSKSKGNVVYLDDLIEKTKKMGKIERLSEDASLDAIRFFLSYYQSLDRDFDWDDNNFRNSGLKGMKRYVTSIERGMRYLKENENFEISSIDKWLSTLDQRTVRDITEKMNEKDLRGAMISLVDIRRRALGDYLHMKNPNLEVLSRFLINQINMGYPVMPRVTKELREKNFPESELFWPKPDQSLDFPEEYEIYEHKTKGEIYEKNLLGALNATLGKMIGRKEINFGETVIVTIPTEHQLQVIQNQKIQLSKRINLKFEVDPTSKGVEIRKENENI